MDKKIEFEALRKLAAEIEKSLNKRQKVCSKSCDQCLFTKSKIVSEERKKEILDDCEKEQTHFICHKGSIVGENIVCNGFFRYLSTPYLELMKATGRIEFIEPLKISAKEKSEKRNISNKRNTHHKKGNGL
ncbi:MAG: hypothetical protein BGO31_20645 [Bacteroidetes bacterium 43-16]|uniref:hypothetical protein n=1 Tax=uncultured Dysgonomonas sp. TaxID=206096 RepID=UPI0009294FD8|nr:hypothetical protein [uncultured Dysgonomonas sp.]OJV55341.1 MAG: hypothetical protein BGO31_20645 [Bacteroidetes bacterium 43-16]